ncbi:MAG: hypothetical protein SPL08_01325 [Pseudomonadota bacterium]|nr:hypothetical protein [Pseudomonadota bacterium]
MIQMILVLTMFLVVVGVVVGLFYIITKDIIKGVKNKNIEANSNTAINEAFSNETSTNISNQDQQKNLLKNPYADIVFGILGLFFMMYIFSDSDIPSQTNYGETKFDNKQATSPELVLSNPQPLIKQNKPQSEKIEQISSPKPILPENNLAFNENNYASYPADFEFGSFLFKIRGKEHPEGTGLEIFSTITNKYGDISGYNHDFWCENDLDDLRCVRLSYEGIGKKKTTRDKYLNKIIKTPLHVSSYSNGMDDDIYLSDTGTDGLQQKYSIRCHLKDPKNIEKFLNEVGNKKSTLNMIGKIAKIDSYNAAVEIDPCYYIDIHQQ